jgi:hypothetical protein
LGGESEYGGRFGAELDLHRAFWVDSEFSDGAPTGMEMSVRQLSNVGCSSVLRNVRFLPGDAFSLSGRGRPIWRQIRLWRPLCKRLHIWAWSRSRTSPVKQRCP